MTDNMNILYAILYNFNSYLSTLYKAYRSAIHLFVLQQIHVVEFGF